MKLNKLRTMALFLVLIPFWLFGQQDYGSVPNRNEFNRLCKKYRSDTISLGEHKIVKVSYKKKYFFGNDNDISAVFDFKIYSIDDKFIIMTYKDIVTNGEKNDEFSFTLDKN